MNKDDKDLQFKPFILKKVSMAKNLNKLEVLKFLIKWYLNSYISYNFSNNWKLFNNLKEKAYNFSITTG